MTPDRPQRREGLTLLEVLAAFLIFSMVFTVLVGSSQTAVHSQGLSTRRLAANEIADGLMADLEVSMARHEMPVIEEEEYLEDPFTVRVREESISEGSPANAATTGDALDAASGVDIIGLLETQLPDVARYLKRYEIEVEWTEASAIQTVSRTTFAFDWPAAQSDATGLFGAAALAGGGLDDADGTQDGDEADGSDTESESGGERASDGDGDGDRSRGKGPSQSELERMRSLIEQKERELNMR